MAKLIKNSFNAGELSPYLDGRTDIAKYYNGCSQMVNAIPLSQGGATKRPGTRYVAATKYSDRKCRLVRFEFSAEDTMILEFGHLYIRFFRNVWPNTTGENGVTDNTIVTDLSQSWGINELVGLWAENTTTGGRGIIASNTATTFTVTSLSTGVFTEGDKYKICRVPDRVMTGHIALDLYAAGIVLNGSDPVKIVTSAANGYTNGDVVRLYNVDGITATGVPGLEYAGNQFTEYTITRVDTTGFTLNGTDSRNYSSTYSGGATVAKIYEVATQYEEDDLFDIHFVESADVIYLTHPKYHPQKLSRLADDNWTIEDIPFVGGPYLEENTDEDLTFKLTGGVHNGGDNQAVLSDENTGQDWPENGFVGYEVYNITKGKHGTITANGTNNITATLSDGANWDNGDVYVVIKNGYYVPAGMKMTLTATGHTPFLGTANDVGQRWQLSHTRADNVLSTFDNNTNATPKGPGIRIKGDFTLDVVIAVNQSAILWRKQGIGQWQQYKSFTSDTLYSSSEEDDDVFYTMTNSIDTVTGKLTAMNQKHDGEVQITAHSSTSVCTVETLSDVYFVAGATDNSTALWAEGAFGYVNGYPKAITMHENRLWLAGTDRNPQTCWGSRSSKFENFTGGYFDNDAISITVEDSDVSKIQWLASDEQLLVGTAKKEYKISASDPDDPITPDDVRSRVQSSHGSYKIQPVLLNNSIFYIQGQGSKVRAMRFVDTYQKYESDDATLLASHIMDSKPVQMFCQRVPESILYIVREDGSMALFVYEPKEEVAAWCRYYTGRDFNASEAQFESGDCVTGEKEDNVWVVVKRKIYNIYDGTYDDVRYVEVFADRKFDSLNDAVYVDCAKIVTASEYPVKTIGYASANVLYDKGVYGEDSYGG
jgi:hypothetical protein